MTTPQAITIEKDFLFSEHRKVAQALANIIISDDTPAIIASDLQDQYDALHSQLESMERIAEQRGWFVEMGQWTPNVELTVEETARNLGMTEKQVRHQLRKGDIKGEKRDGHWVVFAKEVK